ncbi:MAG: helix-hairpin-helix domain-containing protein [Planctomycetota bacterium]|nr:helix-hairpin-helix domain-containing protein [Planctomycetota bacterium]
MNRASMGELQALPGIGPERAGAIVLHRVRHGPFATPSDLSRVWGIGPATSALLQPHATTGSPSGRQRARTR